MRRVKAAHQRAKSSLSPFLRLDLFCGLIRFTTHSNRGFGGRGSGEQHRALPTLPICVPRQPSVMSQKFLYRPCRQEVAPLNAAPEACGHPSRRRLERRRLLRVSGDVLGSVRQFPLTLSRPHHLSGRVEGCPLGETQQSWWLAITVKRILRHYTSNLGTSPSADCPEAPSGLPAAPRHHAPAFPTYIE